MTEGHEAAASKESRSESETILANIGQTLQLVVLLIGQC